MHRNDFGKIDFFGRFLEFSIVSFGPKTAKKHEKLVKTAKNYEDMFLIIQALPKKFLSVYLGLDRSESFFEFWVAIFAKSVLFPLKRFA